MKPLGVFVAVLAAVSVAVFIFFPERFPPGWGFEVTPIDNSTHWSPFEQGGRTTFTNPTGKTLYNVTVVCKNKQLHQAHQYVKEICPPGSGFSIGCEEGWCWQHGETITISASGYKTAHWTIR